MQRCHLAQQTRITNDDIELAETLRDGRTDSVDSIKVGQVQFQQRGKRIFVGYETELGSDAIVDIFKTAPRPRDENDVRAFHCKSLGHRGADTARSPGDQGDTVLQTPGHASWVRNDSCGLG